MRYFECAVKPFDEDLCIEENSSRYIHTSPLRNNLPTSGRNHYYCACTTHQRFMYYVVVYNALCHALCYIFPKALYSTPIISVRDGENSPHVSVLPCSLESLSELC